MSKHMLYQTYVSWLGDPSAAVPFEQLLNFPISCFDVSEDDLHIVNHLIYFIPDFSGDAPRSFFFFEENIFSKDDAGNLYLIHSSFRLFNS